MGYMRHHAIVVTSWNLDLLRKARAKAFGLSLKPTEITPIGVNDYRSFLCPPDGSKEGWAESDVADLARKKFIESLDEMRYDDGSSSVAWVCVQFGDDDGDAKVIDAGDFRKSSTGLSIVHT